MVFEYREEEHASYFKSKLEREGIPYEDHLEAHDDAEKWMFGVHVNYKSKAEKANFLCHAHFRKPMIGNKVVAWSLLVFTASFVILALIGYLKTR
tara:strand:+ start:188 stop:472 length:285 start_codon:yes stop_codon:yes gene_type:complete